MSIFEEYGAFKRRGIQDGHLHRVDYFGFLVIIEALPGVWGNRGIRSFISGEQWNKSLKLKGTREQRQFGGTGNIENQDFDFGEQGEMPFFFRGTREQVPHPHLEGIIIYSGIDWLCALGILDEVVFESTGNNIVYSILSHPVAFDGHLIQTGHSPDRLVVGLLISGILLINKYLFN